MTDAVWEEVIDQEVIVLGDAPGPTFAGVELPPKKTWEERAAAAMPKSPPFKGPPPAKSKQPAVVDLTVPTAHEKAAQPKAIASAPPVKAAPQNKQQSSNKIS